MSFSKIRFNVKKEAGFTLVELLIVIAIIAILAAIAIPQFAIYRIKTEIGVLQTDLKKAFIFAQSYFIDYGQTIITNERPLQLQGFRRSNGIEVVRINLELDTGEIVLKNIFLNTNSVDTNEGSIDYNGNMTLPKVK